MDKMRSLLVVGILMLVGTQVLGQARYVALSAPTPADWGNASHWSATPGGAGGAGIPTATDDVYTNGRTVQLNATGTCRNLFVTYNVDGSLILGSLSTLTITGTLNGWDGAAIAIPNPAVITYNGNGTLEFTGANMVFPYFPHVIYAWDETAPIRRAVFNFGDGNIAQVFLPLSFTQLIRISTGHLVPELGATLSGATATLDVQVGGELTAQDPLGPFASVTVAGQFATDYTVTATGVNVSGIFVSGGLSATNITVASGTFTPGSINATNLTFNGGTHTISNTSTLSGNFIVNSSVSVTLQAPLTASNTTIGGAVTTNSSGSLTTSGVFSVTSTGVFTTNYLGAEGWWLGSNSPSSTDIQGNIRFSSNSPQNIPPVSYFTLTTQGSGAKTVTGSGLEISGNLSQGGTGSLNSNFPISFTGSGNQLVSVIGSSSTNFNGGIIVSKSGGVLAINKDINVQNGMDISEGSVSVSSPRTLTLTGNLITNGFLGFVAGSTLNIPSGSTIVSGGATPSFANINIGVGASLSGTGAIDLAGSTVSSGTLSFGTVNFNGSAAQTITGTNLLTTVNVSNAVGVSNNGTINLAGDLTLTTAGAIFDADGGGSGVLRVLSASQSTGGRIAALPTPSNFTGNITIERYTNGPDTWRYLSMPLTNGNLGMWRSQFSVTGNFSDATTPAQDPNVISASAPSVYAFNANQATPDWVALSAGGGATSTVNLANTTGYSAYIYNPSDFTFSVTGNPGKGNVGASLFSNGSGWNLVGNPYPSAIDWDNIADIGTDPNISSTMYLRVSNNVFASFNKGAGTGTGHPNGGWAGEIAMGQAFWVQATGNTTLDFQESAKTGTYTFIRKAEPENLLRVRVTTPGNKHDETIIYFNPEATTARDAFWDGEKYPNIQHVNLSSYNFDNPGLHYVFNGLPYLTKVETYSVGLSLTSVTPGTHVLTFSELNRMSLGYSVTLIDHYTDTETEINDLDTYEFTVTDDAESFGVGRFEVIFRRGLITSVEESLASRIRYYPNPVADRLFVTLPQGEVQNVKKVSVLSLMGQELDVEQRKEVIASGQVEFDFGSKASGLYILTIATGTETASFRVLKK